jgi:hypothetical protein
MPIATFALGAFTPAAIVPDETAWNPIPEQSDVWTVIPDNSATWQEAA